MHSNILYVMQFFNPPQPCKNKVLSLTCICAFSHAVNCLRTGVAKETSQSG